jgi:trehalose 6-phosphate synthase/phosphatase
VRTLARAAAADAVLYLGDDVTDETVFAVLEDRDLGIKVGGGDTAATQRLADVDAVADFLQDLLEKRRARE